MIKDVLKQDIQKASGESVDFSLEIPSNPEHGDYSSNPVHSRKQRNRDVPSKSINICDDALQNSCRSF